MTDNISEIRSTAGDLFSGTSGAVIAAGAAGFGLGILAAAGRRAAVQAPTYFAGDWLDGIKREHEMALELFDAIEETDASEPKKRAALLLQLQHALGKHAVEEEDVIYCAVRDHGADENADELVHDHGVVKQFLYDLEKMDKSDPLWIVKVREFRSHIEAHMREEEEEILPRLHDRLSDEQNQKLTNRMNREGFKVA
ncbi:hypothetical protein B5C34_12100 [Pacificimonas flava]|uniref:Hemerythrin-like domain-containing protein n=2 Tax=Pacificimonas TaxID=1960290 RepID=A0A219B788_9SPHN|nr:MULTISPECIES: hemerythrin domain-containing protein [Pacificimonas]MBZ6378592.1 hemerythrin domain-containing protein [Pacificimonas aurantium]OWV34131.1 hypothetical protein B5C34_12100 [Pacificimonas flava]